MEIGFGPPDSNGGLQAMKGSIEHIKELNKKIKWSGKYQ
jgi:hypothetical protein